MENKYQVKFGYPVQRTAGKVKPQMASWIQDFIRHSPFCVLATSNADGDCDASPKGGMPGFVKVLNDRQLFIPDVAGNKLFHGYGNIESNPKVGLVFFIPGHNQTVRVNGGVRVIDRAELQNVNLEVHDPDEKAEVLQGLLLDVEESYSHCPRALKFSKL
jgi:predicted pyridoxine 5'-phosphate oxidase superfamily flavin-nucleotide-binding protein